jgi:hypothetical protein
MPGRDIPEGVVQRLFGGRKTAQAFPGDGPAVQNVPELLRMIHAAE